MPSRLENKVLFITGSTGIAAATSLLAARAGARLFIAGLEAEDCTQLTDRIRADGGICEFHAGDLTVAAEAAAAVARCLECFGQVDGLFNVAGISGRRFGDGPLHECTDEGWDVTMTTNVRSMFLVSRPVLSHMLSRPIGESGVRGAILNMASVLAFSPELRHFTTHAYVASKGAIVSLTQAMAAYYARHKIRVNCIAPGLVRTRMSRRAQQDPDVLSYIRSKQPLAEDLLAPEDVAQASVFLLSDKASMITGQILTVDGGWSVSGT